MMICFWVALCALRWPGDMLEADDFKCVCLRRPHHSVFIQNSRSKWLWIVTGEAIWKTRADGGFFWDHQEASKKLQLHFISPLTAQVTSFIKRFVYFSLLPNCLKAYFTLSLELFTKGSKRNFIDHLVHPYFTEEKAMIRKRKTRIQAFQDAVFQNLVLFDVKCVPITTPNAFYPKFFYIPQHALHRGHTAQPISS